MAPLPPLLFRCDAALSNARRAGGRARDDMLIYLYNSPGSQRDALITLPTRSLDPLPALALEQVCVPGPGATAWSIRDINFVSSRRIPRATVCVRACVWVGRL